ncbi:Arm DNA-binding domain-containing protein [Ectorhizobium quercum]|uniref:Arm DNA-binding domain-containing protein n=1 Tax=Ectorhizobium quercum TaxID=2965071 RepID=UPI002795B0AD|nr:Arm DNA-binding domain-containing protein [Ectorhizobium quercum]
MTTDRLGDAALRSIKPCDKPFKLTDGGGLFLLVNPNGSRLWRLAYGFAGRQKLLALGSYPATLLADAREARGRQKGYLRQASIRARKRKSARSL